MQDQLRAGLGDHGPEAFGADQPAMPWRRAGDRWMVDQHDAKQSLLAKSRQLFLETVRLRLVDPAGRHQRCRGYRGRHGDDRDRTAPAGEREDDRRRAVVVADHVWPPCVFEVSDGAREIGVMVAGYGRDILRIAKTVEPDSGGLDFSAKADVDEVAGDRDMVVRAGEQICDQMPEGPGPERGAPAPVPVDVSENPLRDEFVPADRRQRSEVRIRKLNEAEHGRATLCWLRRRPSADIWSYIAYKARGDSVPTHLGSESASGEQG